MYLDKKWCKHFLIITGVMFLVGGVLYGLLGRELHNIVEDIPAYAMLLFPSLGGLLLAGILGGFMMFARWVSNRRLAVKVLCAVLFPITFAVIGISGIVGTPFMALYSLIFLIRGDLDKVD